MLSLLLALCMVFSTIPSGAFAADTSGGASSVLADDTLDTDAPDDKGGTDTDAPDDKGGTDTDAPDDKGGTNSDVSQDPANVPMVTADEDDSDSDYVAEVGDIGYTDLTDAIAAAKTSTGSTLKLLANVTSTISANSGSFTLDLNGYDISVEANSAISVSGGAELIIQDTSEAGTGTIEATGSSGHGVSNDSGTVTIEGGTIEATGSSGRGVYNYGESAEVTISQAEGSTTSITGGRYGVCNDNGTVAIKDGTIKATGNYGEGVSNYNGTVTIEGGTIEATDDSGCGVFNYGESAEVTISQAESSTTSITGGSYGVFNNSGTVTIKGGTIEATGGYGYGVSNDSGTVTIKDGTIEATGSSGHGVYNTSGTVTIEGGTIEATGEESYGIRTYDVVNLNDAADISGTLAAFDVIISDENPGCIIVNTDLDDTFYTVKADAGTVFAVAGIDEDDNKIALAPAWFTSYDGNSVVLQSDVGLYLGTVAASVTTAGEDGTTTTYGSLDDAIAAAKTSTGSTLKLLADVTSTISINSGSFILDLNGYDISVEAKTAISVSGGAELIIQDTSEAGTGTIEATGSSGHGVYNTSGTVTIKGGTIEATGDYGYGVYNYNGTVTIEGGTIEATDDSGYGVYNSGESAKVTISQAEGSTTSITGGRYGVFNNNNGTVSIEGGTIEATGSSGNGVYNTRGTVTIKGGTIEATGSSGRGVYNYSGSGTVTIKGGTIKATGDSGYGVSNDSGTVTIEGGTIEATGSSGDGVYNTSGTVTIKDGTIKATGDSGYGVCNYYGTVSIEGGTIEATDDSGRGVYNYGESAEVTISQAEGSTTSITGGSYGVFNNSGTVTIKGGTIEATGDSGYGVCNYYGTVTIEGGTIEATDDSGRGVYSCGESAEVTISQAEGSTTSITGGSYGVYNDNGTVTIEGGTIEATGSSGNGVYNDSGTVEISGGTIEATGSSGDGVCNDNGTVTIEGGTIEATGEESYGIRTYDVVNLNDAADISGTLAAFDVIISDENPGCIIVNTDLDDTFYTVKADAGTVFAVAGIDEDDNKIALAPAWFTSYDGNSVVLQSDVGLYLGTFVASVTTAGEDGTTTTYGSLDDAIVAAEENAGSTLKLLADTEDLYIYTGTYTLDLNGHSVYGLLVWNTAQLTVIDSDGNGWIEAYSGANIRIRSSNCHLTIDESVSCEGLWINNSTTEDYSELTVSDVLTLPDGYILVDDDGVEITKLAYNGNGIVAEKPYDVYVGGIGLNNGEYLIESEDAEDAFEVVTELPDGTNSYAYYEVDEDENGILTLSNFNYLGYNSKSSAVYSSNDLTIKLAGENELEIIFSSGISIDVSGEVTFAAADPEEPGTLIATAAGSDVLAINSSGIEFTDGLTILSPFLGVVEYGVVYGHSGSHVQTVTIGTFEGGSYDVAFNGTDVTSDGAETATYGTDYTAQLTTSKEGCAVRISSISVTNPEDENEVVTLIEEEDYSFEDGKLTINGEVIQGSITITAYSLRTGEVYVGGIGLNNGEYLDLEGNVSNIQPESGYAYYEDGTLTLSDYSYEGWGYQINSGWMAAVYSDKSITIELIGENTLTNTCESVKIWSDVMVVEADLTITGSGALNVVSQNGDGIYISDGDLTIESGTVTAESYYNGIYVYDGDLTINGGEVTATGGDDGIYVSGGDLTIESGTVTAEGYYNGIHVSDGDLTINGGEVTATGGDDGIYVEYGNLTINGGTVTAESSVENDYDGIHVSDGDLTITSGEVTATGGDDGIYVEYGNLTIESGTVTAEGYYNGIHVSDGDLTINGGEVTATGGDDGISVEYGNLTIESGTVTAEGYYNGIYVSVGDLTIESGTVTAESSVENDYDGIYVYVGDLTITGGEVTATGGEYGIYAESGSLTVAGGEVTATGSVRGIYTSYLTIVGGITTAESTSDDGIAIYAMNGITYTSNMTVTTPENGSIEDGFVVDETRVPATKAVIEETGDVEIFVGGIGLGDGDYLIESGDTFEVVTELPDDTTSYAYYKVDEDENGILTLSNFTCQSGYELGEVFAPKDVTIQLEGENVLGGLNGYDYGIYALADLTITGDEEASLYVSGMNAGICVTAGNLTINGGTILAAALEFGIAVGYGDLTINDGEVNTIGYNGGGIYVYESTMTVEGGTVNCGTVSDDIIGDGTSDTLDKVEQSDTIFGAYGIYVDGGSLTINDGEVNAEGEQFGIIVSSDNVDSCDLTIAGGEVNAKGSYIGICVADGDLTITGGVVTAEDGYEGIYIYGGDLTIEDGTVTAEGEWYGIYVDGGYLIINGGTVTAEGEWDGIYVDGGDLTINGGTVTAEGEWDGIYVDGGYLTINDGTVSGTGTNDSQSGGIEVWEGYLIINGGTVTGTGTIAGVMAIDGIELNYVDIVVPKDGVVGEAAYSDEEYDITFEYFTVLTGDDEVAKTVVIMKHVHSYDEPEFTWSEDYTAEATFTCNKCDEDAENHVLTKECEVNFNVETAPTCTTAGEKIYTATVTLDGAEYTDTKDEELPETGHSYGEPEFTWNEDYTAEATFTCGKCDEDAENHVLTKECVVTSNEETAPTCTTAGKKIYTATVTLDGAEYTDTKDEELPETGHSYGEPEFTWSKDYTAEAIFTCDKCDEDAENHVLTKECEVTSNVETAPTCTTAGQKIYTATVTLDGEEYTDTQKEPLEKLAHTKSDAVVENEVDATCTAEGSYDEVIYCSVCEEELSRETKTIEKLPHTYDETQWSHNADTHWHECSVCHNKLDEAAHTPGAEATETTAQTCTICGAVIVPALGHTHSYGEAEYKWSADYKTLSVTVTCSGCGDKLTDVAESTSATVEATCTTAGKTIYTATVILNGVGYTDARTVTLPATGHSYGEPEFTWNEDGTVIADFVCTECSETETVDCSVSSETIAATCTAEGKTVTTATVTMGDKNYSDVKTVILPVIDHADADSDGTCDSCGEDMGKDEPDVVETIHIYRLYNPNSGEHFYTGSVDERNHLMAVGWTYEGIAGNAPVYEGDPVYRLYNPYGGDHHYTMNSGERDALVALGWKYEGVAWNSASDNGEPWADAVPQYRLYNPNQFAGNHHYTSSVEEKDSLVEIGWKDEGIGWYSTLK